MLAAYMFVSVLLFAIGATGAMIRRNFLIVLMSLELMINGAGMALIVMSYYIGNVSGQVMFLFVAAVAASETAVGLAIVAMMYKNKKSVDINDFTTLRK
ncbi:NADH-ubiquinone oxidoreductase chain K [Desulfurella amilsii]|jgi:NADH-quinone oxidoreductase subunit K|uniref:NADH-quinone oxidoreductase subunit K n=1 Tax=Desulfurella amilsii TaxID=1562698 RepID=A0A1X4XUD5_9BACT|nr:NADH-quinone oxidoreductase subunit NuoK [Desulfurella amilsii]OSS41149.1 NADH-ubiquinone oxidoreductase chain K [Desulfurella amilsii]